MATPTGPEFYKKKIKENQNTGKQCIHINQHTYIFSKYHFKQKVSWKTMICSALIAYP